MLTIQPANSSRDLIIVIFCFLAMTACDSPSATAPAGPPNIVLIFADDLGYGDLSTYGHPTIHTPRLDEIAREGIKLTSFYTAAPVCTPSRAALLTGRFPIRFGLPDNVGPESQNGLPQEERTLAEALKERGYRDTNPTDEQPVDQHTLTRRYTEAAIDFISRSEGQPFFVYLPHSMPHMPVYASEKFQGKSKGGRYGDVIEELDWSAGAILDFLIEEGLEDNTLFIFTSDNGPWRNMPPRMFETEPVEKWHGGTTGPLRGAKATTYEGGFRVPAILRWPGRIPAGQVSAEIATTMDLHATILNLAGASPPPNPLDGLDIWPLLAEGAPSPHDYYFYFRVSRLEAVRDAQWKLRIAMPASNWESPELQTGDEPIHTELFNLKNDPFEQFDLSVEYPEVVERLKGRMVSFAEETGARLEFEP